MLHIISVCNLVLETNHSCMFTLTIR